MFSWKGLHHAAPLFKTTGKGTGSVKKPIQTFGKSASPSRGLDCITQRHLFKGEKQIGSGFNPHGMCGNLGKLSLLQEGVKSISIECFFPLNMCSLLITSLPSVIFGITESIWEKAKKFKSARLRFGRTRQLFILHRTNAVIAHR